MAARFLAFAIAVIALVRGAAPAYAEEKPWAAGVSQDNQAAALALYKEGNGFFEQDQYRQALDKYDEALKLWDHPAIRYNAMICLIQLERPVDAYVSLLSAVRFGEQPLGPDLFKEAARYRKLLEGQVGEIEVQCDEPSAEVTLDGKPLFKAPGSKRQWVLSGQHQILATKPRFQTETLKREVSPNKRTRVEIAMKRSVSTGWRWTPWVFVSSGALVAAVGGGLYWKARSDLGRYDNYVKTNCYVSGCNETMIPSATASLRTTAYALQTPSIVIMSVGGAAIATGLVLLQLRTKSPTVVPTVGADHAGMAISGQW
jgi:hypothetical protein